MACLGDASRFRLVVALAEAERCVTELALAVGLSQSCTTRHLQALRREGLVRARRQGRRVLLSLEAGDAVVAGVLAWTLGPRGGGPPTGGADLHQDAVRADARDAGPRAMKRTPEQTSSRHGPRAPLEDDGAAASQGRAEAPAGPEGPPESDEGSGGPIRTADLEDYLL